MGGTGVSPALSFPQAGPSCACPLGYKMGVTLRIEGGAGRPCPPLSWVLGRRSKTQSPSSRSFSLAWRSFSAAAAGWAAAQQGTLPLAAPQTQAGLFPLWVSPLVLDIPGTLNTSGYSPSSRAGVGPRGCQGHLQWVSSSSPPCPTLVPAPSPHLNGPQAPYGSPQVCKALWHHGCPYLS